MQEGKEKGGKEGSGQQKKVESVGGLCIVLTPFIFSSPKSSPRSSQNPRGVPALNLKSCQKLFRDILKGEVGRVQCMLQILKTYIFCVSISFVSFLFNKVSFFKKTTFSRL